MKRIAVVSMCMSLLLTMFSCNDGMSSARDSGQSGKKRDRSQRTVIDAADYIDFTVAQYNAFEASREDMLYALNNVALKNGNSTIKIKAQEGTIEITSDKGLYNGKSDCQVFGVFAFDIKAASTDCLYIRRDPAKEGFVLIDNIMFRNDAIPDLAVCLPLYGYSRNRLEVSSVMDGYIVMPSGTYWK